MPTYILLYRGPTGPEGAAHEGWPEWFSSLGDALVDIGSPMVNGRSTRPDGRIESASDLNGFSLVKADSPETVEQLIASHPFLRASDENAIEVFALPGKDG